MDDRDWDQFAIELAHGTSRRRIRRSAGMDVGRMSEGGTGPVTRSVDVAIVGGGVAGASVAAALATAGLGVVVVEREPRFRDRVRGETIHPWGAREADRLGLLSVLHAAGVNEMPLWQSYTDRAPREPYRWADDTPDGYVELESSTRRYSKRCSITRGTPDRRSCGRPA